MNTACENYEIQEKLLVKRLKGVEKNLSITNKKEKILERTATVAGIGLGLLAWATTKDIKSVLIGTVIIEALNLGLDNKIEELERSKDVLEAKLKELEREQLKNGCISEEKINIMREIREKITDIDKNIHSSATDKAWDRVVRDIDSKPSFTFDKPFSK